MPALLIRHKVADYQAWRSSFDDHGWSRFANGSLGGQIYRSAVDPGDVLIVLAWDDLERARLFADSDDLHEAMTQAGVTDVLDILLLEEDHRTPR